MASSALARALSAAAAALLSKADDLNRLDGYAGDGDLGVTMSEVARVLEEESAEVGIPGAGAGEAGGMGAAQLLSSCGSAIARRAPSTMGTLTATAFLRAAKALASEGASEVELAERCFAAAMEGVQARGKASLGDRTVLDGLDAVCTSLRTSLGAGVVLSEALRSAARASSLAAEASKSMVPKAGRASWVPERALGHPDAGCQALAIALGAVAESLEES
jgi:dihydroxyacetone kinase